MHKDEEVAEIATEPDFEHLKILNIIKKEHIPFCIPQNDEEVDIGDINIHFARWMKMRTIPKERIKINEILSTVETDTYSLLQYSFGFSLSDHYWFKPEGSTMKWSTYNFFDNPFSEWMSKLLVEKCPTFIKTELNSPDNTTIGCLPKFWRIINGMRYLFKAGSSPYFQEPINEEIASLLFTKLSIPHVDYETFDVASEESKTPKLYSRCKCLTDQNYELVTCDEILQHFNLSASYNNFIDICIKLGISDIQKRVDQMIIADFILANQDRHIQNFGLLRDSTTLQFVSFAPIFDTGDSLLFDSNEFDTGLYKDYCKPFAMRQYLQIKFVTDLSWFNYHDLDGFEKEVEQILSKHPHFIESRTSSIVKFIRQRIDLVQLYKESLKNNFDPEFDKRFNPNDEHFQPEEGETFDPFELL